MSCTAIGSGESKNFAWAMKARFLIFYYIIFYDTSIEYHKTSYKNNLYKLMARYYINKLKQVFVTILVFLRISWFRLFGARMALFICR